jgi:DNA-binding transcriptional MocR family regulator
VAEGAAVLRFERPAGGSAVWCDVDPGVDVERWAARSLERGVGFSTGRHFFVDERAAPHLWLGFAGLDETELARAVATIAGALPRAGRGVRRRGDRRTLSRP